MKLRVDRCSLLHIAADHIEIRFLLIAVERLIIIRIQDLRKFMVTEIRVHKVSGPYHVLSAHKAFVRTVFFIIPDTSPPLPGQETASMYCACRDTDHAVKFKPLIQKDIEHPRGIDPAHAAAFENKTCLILCSIFTFIVQKLFSLLLQCFFLLSIIKGRRIPILQRMRLPVKEAAFCKSI